VELTADEAREAIDKGIPLLQAGRVGVDPHAVEDELRRLSRNLAETAELGTAAQRTAEKLGAETVDLAPLLGPALSAERATIERAAGDLGVDADALAELLELALQPFLWEATARLGALTDIDRWDRGYCPVCGAWPGLAELLGPEKRRALRCVRCGVMWSWFVLLCPYCGNDDHRTLGVLQEEGSPSRVDVCRSCNGYVKAIPSYTPSAAVMLAAADVTTMHLDLAAGEAGYKRPGDVDVRTAGIPRLVRQRASYAQE